MGGGNPVLGYDVDPGGGRLLINQQEAERVREIFSICARTETIAQAVREVNTRGLKTKDWISKAEKHHRGREFQHSTLELLIRKFPLIVAAQPPVIKIRHSVSFNIRAIRDSRNYVQIEQNTREKRVQRGAQQLREALLYWLCTSSDQVSAVKLHG